MAKLVLEKTEHFSRLERNTILRSDKQKLKDFVEAEYKDLDELVQKMQAFSYSLHVSYTVEEQINTLPFTVRKLLLMYNEGIGGNNHIKVGYVKAVD